MSVWTNDRQPEGSPKRRLIEAREPPVAKEWLQVREHVRLVVFRIHVSMESCAVVDESISELNQHVIDLIR